MEVAVHIIWNKFTNVVYLYGTRVSGRISIPPVGYLSVPGKFVVRCFFTHLSTADFSECLLMTNVYVVGGNGRAVRQTGSLSVYILLLYSRRDFIRYSKKARRKKIKWYIKTISEYNIIYVHTTRMHTHIGGTPRNIRWKHIKAHL